MIPEDSLMIANTLYSNIGEGPILRIKDPICPKTS